MKIRILIPLIAACAGTLLAEPPQPGGPQPQFPGHGGPGGDQQGGPRDKMRGMMREKILDNMPPELRERFEAAREKAMQDPAIQELKKKADAANDEFRKAMRDAITKADPGLADQIKDRMKEKGGGRDGKPGEPPGFSNLSEGDRQKLMAAREIAKDDPAVKAAEALKESAKTPDDRRAAMEQFHKAMKAALLKADPSLAPILEQLKPQGPPPRPNGPPNGPAMPGMAPGDKPGA